MIWLRSDEPVATPPSSLIWHSFYIWMLFLTRHPAVCYCKIIIWWNFDLDHDFAWWHGLDRSAMYHIFCIPIICNVSFELVWTKTINAFLFPDLFWILGVKFFDKFLENFAFPFYCKSNVQFLIETIELSLVQLILLFSSLL